MQFTDEGVSRIEDIEDLTKSKLTELGLTKTQSMRSFNEVNEGQEQSPS